jgi:hypothetical protein
MPNMLVRILTAIRAPVYWPFPALAAKIAGAGGYTLFHVWVNVGNLYLQCISLLVGLNHLHWGFFLPG